MASFSWGGMSYEQLKYMLDNGGVPRFAQVGARAYLKRLEHERNQRAAAAAPAQPPAPAAPPVDIDKIRERLKGQEAEFVEAQTANIDRDAERNLAQGMSNMIGSGLAGTSVVGGMQAGVQEVATRAKGDVAARASAQTEQLVAQYANLGQAASEAAANRQFQASQNQANRAHQIRLAEMNNVARVMPSAGGGGGFGKKYPNLGLVGKPAPNLF